MNIHQFKSIDKLLEYSNSINHLTVEKINTIKEDHKLKDWQFLNWNENMFKKLNLKRISHVNELLLSLHSDNIAPIKINILPFKVRNKRQFNLKNINKTENCILNINDKIIPDKSITVDQITSIGTQCFEAPKAIISYSTHCTQGSLTDAKISAQFDAYASAIIECKSKGNQFDPETKNFGCLSLIEFADNFGQQNKKLDIEKVRNLNDQNEIINCDEENATKSEFNFLQVGTHAMTNNYGKNPKSLNRDECRIIKENILAHQYDTLNGALINLEKISHICEDPSLKCKKIEIYPKYKTSHFNVRQHSKVIKSPKELHVNLNTNINWLLFKNKILRQVFKTVERNQMFCRFKLSNKIECKIINKFNDKEKVKNIILIVKYSDQNPKL